jgi:hypothetical protein
LAALVDAGISADRDAMSDRCIVTGFERCPFVVRESAAPDGASPARNNSRQATAAMEEDG